MTFLLIIFLDFCIFNESIKKSTFPSLLKNANITPVFKKGYRGPKENYRPASVLPVVSKSSVKFLWEKIAIIIDPLQSKYQYGFRKGLTCFFKKNNVYKHTQPQFCQKYAYTRHILWSFC